MIVAYGRNRAIGKDNKIPWHQPADLAFFKRTTMGCPIIMGRNTFLSIGKPLPGRTSIVVSRSGAVQHEGAEGDVRVVDGLVAALAACGGAAEAFVIGGAQIYQSALPLAQRIYATEIDANFDADVFFPPLPPNEWREASRTRCAFDPENRHTMDFVVFERVQ